MMITALHGFLGLPSDWDFLRAAGLEVDSRNPGHIPPRGDILLGYSMGGRLGLRALLDGARYTRGVIVSAGLGIEVEEERVARRTADESWASRFETEEWSGLMRSWDAQPIFGGHRMVRRESDFDRATLADDLRRQSPAALEPLAPRLHEIAIPILWIVGERDPRYVAQARRAVALLPDAELWICPGAAHRVPWEQPELFAARLLAI
ncbi:MAG: alpha/beta fold hydrolase [Thermoanaerobaculia bacterium]|nr:alpha/beta fold hydrolase [Thermoanaerobaculia bacterium]